MPDVIGSSDATLNGAAGSYGSGGTRFLAATTLASAVANCV
jgi:hypothetical protein